MTSPASASPVPKSPASAPNSPRGRFLWHELHTRDTAAALAFYPTVAGWTTTAMTVAEGTPPYTMFANGTSGLAGVVQHSKAQTAVEARSSWLTYIGTDDVDATARHAKVLGAKETMPPTDIPTVGRMAVLTDPQGAAFALFTPSSSTPPEVEPQQGEFAWHDMSANDPDAAFEFYASLFGWEKTTAVDMGSDGIYQMYGQGGFTYGGMLGRGPNSPAPFWNPYIRVANLDTSCDAVRRNGGKIMMGPHGVSSGDRIAMCADNQGALFSLVGK